MDFSATEAATDLGGLVRAITESVCTPEHHRALDDLPERVDTALWERLVTADVVSAAAPETVGGGGFGAVEQVAILTALGRRLAAVPYLESVVLAAGAIAAFGAEHLRARWAIPAVAGATTLTTALDGEMGQGAVLARQARADRFTLTGTRTLVGFGPVADAFLIPAQTPAGTAVFLVARDDPGVTTASLDTTGHDSLGHLELHGVPVPADRMIGGPQDGQTVLRWLTTRAALARSAYQLGVLERALELTAQHAREREQFDRPIGSFQAVSARLADGYIDVKALRLTVIQAAWRLAEGLPAELEVGSAAFWAADAGHRVAHTAVHVHGGVGIDTDHPIHRYFLAAKQAEFAVGGATGQLLRIGRDLAETPA